ncbi:nucleolar GTP-binding protein 1 [Brassica rapa]|uniref:Uncharacterized protein n=1 Tax=Brassica campestris TaxID=3711 RepID=A0A3P5YNK0_BRACM|nr:nucleolar GTP-binding protein 1 [Brassica rapa]CAG7867827.1 unnamed protein product [Brassica rapa]VDC64675.1 unnamed protein product [Brassica rapa]
MARSLPRSSSLRLETRKLCSFESTGSRRLLLRTDQPFLGSLIKTRSTRPREWGGSRLLWGWIHLLRWTVRGASREGGRGTGLEDAMDVDDEEEGNKKMRVRSKSRPPAAHEVVPGDGFKDSTQKKAALKISNSSHKKRDKNAKRGEADRVIPTLRPKHLFSGKRGKGKTDRR